MAVVFFACSKDYLKTEFYVKNTSSQTINFDITIVKHSTITGPYEISLPFTLNVNDSVLARRTEMKKDGKNPQEWFTKFVIHPVEGIQMNDPNLPENWIKYNTNDTPIYVFTLNKN
jgi:hypothetical protein